jgi:hypothetical protein
MLGLLAILAPTCIQAGPLLLAFEPSVQTQNAGDAFFVDVVLQGLDPAVDTDLVSAFDLDVLFDPTIVSFAGVTFGASLGSDFDQFGEASATGGLLDVFQFSFLSDADLKGLQPGTSMTLFTISFVALAPGFSPLAFDTTTQYFAGALDFSNDPQGIATILEVGVQSGGVTVTPLIHGVPIPDTLWLCAAALLALGWQQHRTRRT